MGNFGRMTSSANAREACNRGSSRLNVACRGSRNLLWLRDGVLCTTMGDEPEEHCVTCSSLERGVSSSLMDSSTLRG